MEFAKRGLSVIAALVMAAVIPVSVTQAGADHSEWQFEVVDYNDCTDEMVMWTVTVRETLLDSVTPSGQGQFVDLWLWEGTVVGQSSGFLWSTKGLSPYVETYSLENTLTGGFILLENSLLKPVTQGAPRIRLDVRIRMAYNAAGELVVDRFKYTYHCVAE